MALLEDTVLFRYKIYALQLIKIAVKISAKPAINTAVSEISLSSMNDQVAEMPVINP
jgi:hypothetical protein